MKMKYLGAIFGLFLTCSAFGTNNVKTQVECKIQHPALPWSPPAEYTWSGRCQNDLASGWGWYRFNLKTDGFEQTHVEVFMEFNDAVSSKEFYFARMTTKDTVDFEGLAEFGGYQISVDDCRKKSSCELILLAKENDGKPPMPPKAPKEPTPVAEPQKPLDPVAASREDFLYLIRVMVPIFLHLELSEDPGAHQEALTAFANFGANWVQYAEYICQRGGQNLASCEKYQLDVMYNLIQRILGKTEGDGYFVRTHSFTSFSETVCANLKSVGEMRNCIQRNCDIKGNRLSQVHPKAMAKGIPAILDLSYAISISNGYTGSRRTLDAVGNYERFLQFLDEQVRTPWNN